MTGNITNVPKNYLLKYLLFLILVKKNLQRCGFLSLFLRLNCCVKLLVRFTKYIEAELAITHWQRWLLSG